MKPVIPQPSPARGISGKDALSIFTLSVAMLIVCVLAFAFGYGLANIEIEFGVPKEPTKVPQDVRPEQTTSIYT